MRKKKLIISVVVAVCVLACVFFAMRFGVVGIIYDVIQNWSAEEVPEELIYETELDKDGNEYVVEMRKVIGAVDEEGNEVDFWEDTSEPIRIYDNYYKGKIEKIEENKIYIMVDKEDKTGGGFFLKNVKDYEVVFDIDTFDFKSDPHSNYYSDSITFDGKHFYSAEELEFLVGKYLRVQDSLLEDYYTADKYKILFFQ